MKEKVFVCPGDRFGQLLVIAEVQPDKYSHKRYLCQCDCGDEVVVVKSQLTSGRTKSCGCYQRRRARETHIKHGGCGERLYSVWKSMRQRCYNPNSADYHNYGGRGIEICAVWSGDDGFSRFREWAEASGYAPGLEIDRINNNEGYAPENCRWVTKNVQANNKRNNIVVECGGVTRTVSQWAQQIGADDRKIRQRLRKLGWDGPRAVFTP